MQISKILLAILISSVSNLSAETKKLEAGNKKTEVTESFPKEDYLLLNLKSANRAYILKDSKLTTIQGVSFLQGVIADIGDESREAGIVAYILLEDITSIRVFTKKQAKTYYGNSYRELSQNKLSKPTKSN